MLYRNKERYKAWRIKYRLKNKEKDGVNRFLSEDYYFCRLAEECGFEIWTDLSTEITHLGSCEYHGKMIDQLNRR